ncbi:hypothetical protein JYU34_019402 [Plutella xylostella]|uniref:Uncharacterized protein n=1 Tax=Plutella xylostella TaxID=51655 RepID=A0ABQ7PWR4_PLUXY|nr:hypothetical protein JYU34_019402 [Plutella xylostella]
MCGCSGSLVFRIPVGCRPTAPLPASPDALILARDGTTAIDIDRCRQVLVRSVCMCFFTTYSTPDMSVL